MRLDAMQDVGKIADGQVDWNPVRFFYIVGIDISLSPEFVCLLRFRADKLIWVGLRN